LQRQHSRVRLKQYHREYQGIKETNYTATNNTADVLATNDDDLNVSGVAAADRDNLVEECYGQQRY